MTPRDERYSRTIGTRPFSGHRYVMHGVVKIEWRAGGRRRTRAIGKNTAANRELADRTLEAALREARARAEGRHTPAPLTLQELLAKHRQDAAVRRHPRSGKPLRPLTLRNYEDHEELLLTHLDGAAPAGTLRKGKVREAITALRRLGLAEGSIARAVDYLKQAYRWAAGEMELLEVDPIAGIRSPSRAGDTPVYAREEGRKLLNAALQLDRGRAWRFRLMVLLEASYGVRSQQPLQLRWPDVDFDRAYRVAIPSGEVVELVGALTFRQDAIGSKGQKDRTLPMLPLVREALLQALNHRRDGSPWVIWNWRDASRPARYDSLLAELRKLERRAGVATIKGRGFHAFRRALSTALTEALGVSQASQIIGDTPEVILRHYLKPTPQAQAEAIRYLMGQWIHDREWQPNGNEDDEELAGDGVTAAVVGLTEQARQDSNLQPPDRPPPRTPDQSSDFPVAAPATARSKSRNRPPAVATKWQRRTFQRKGSKP